MPMEKEGYREMLMFLTAEKKAPNMLSRGGAAKLMGISRDKVAELIYRGVLKIDKSTNEIPIGSIAKFLCG